MNVNPDLDKLEKKTATVLYQDGILDMSLGLALIVYGVAAIPYDIWPIQWTVLGMFLIYALFATPLFLVQIYVTKPRIGTVKYKPSRKKKKLGMMIFTSILLIANIVLFILISQGLLQFSGNDFVIAAMFGVVTFFLYVLMAYFMDFSRLYVIGILFSLGVFFMQFFAVLELPLIGRISAMGFGLIIIAIGAVYLYRFLKKYPKPGGQEFAYEQS